MFFVILLLTAGAYNQHPAIVYIYIGAAAIFYKVLSCSHSGTSLVPRPLRGWVEGLGIRLLRYLHSAPISFSAWSINNFISSVFDVFSEVIIYHTKSF